MSKDKTCGFGSGWLQDDAEEEINVSDLFLSLITPSVDYGLNNFMQEEAESQHADKKFDYEEDVDNFLASDILKGQESIIQESLGLNDMKINSSNTQPTEQLSQERKVTKQGKTKKQTTLSEEIEKKVKKNSLQFCSGKIWEFFKKSDEYSLDQDQFGLITELKNSPSLNKFDMIFNQPGMIKAGLSKFFEISQLSKLILTSKCRNYSNKVANKKMANLLRKSFIIKSTGQAILPSNQDSDIQLFFAISGMEQQRF